MKSIKLLLCFLGLSFVLPTRFTLPLLAKGSDWDSPSLWTVETDENCSLDIRPAKGIDGVRMDLHYTLQGPGVRWVQMVREWDGSVLEGPPLTFVFRSDTDLDATMEVKIIDKDGSNFICRYPLKEFKNKWTSVVLYRESFEYGWGEDGNLDKIKSVAIAISGKAQNGVLVLDEVGPGRPGQPATDVPGGPRLDPQRNAQGRGFKQRRAARATKEDPLVYEWLKAVQDSSSLEKQLLPSMEDNQVQTFNNALAAIVFIMKDDRERAERILDFYASSTREYNRNPTLQNFFVNGEPRGFYQDMYLADSAAGPAMNAPEGSDRWIGDMAWLLIAVRFHAQRYDPDRYERLSGLLTKLLVSFFKPVGNGGFIQTGWQKNDRAKHGQAGHPEGNLDCYAALQLAGRKDVAEKIKTWLHQELVGSRLPLDLYSWRVLALGPDYANALAVPEYDFRYRKNIRVNARPTMGFYHGPTPDSNNIWVEGIAHMSCAYVVAGDLARAQFYANQLDSFVMDRVIEGRRVKSLPYVPYAVGDYKWVHPDRGFTSTVAWYIFAKNQFNPFTLTSGPPPKHR